MLGKFYPERHMRRIERLSKLNCWMDVFEGSYFEGRMRRLFGPIRIAPLSAGSVIVGPEASAQLIAQRRGPGRQVIVRFPPKTLVPNLSLSLHGASLQSALLICGSKRHR
jgi:hypothetical protein